MLPSRCYTLASIPRIEESLTSVSNGTDIRQESVCTASKAMESPTIAPVAPSSSGLGTDAEMSEQGLMGGAQWDMTNTAIVNDENDNKASTAMDEEAEAEAVEDTMEYDENQAEMGDTADPSAEYADGDIEIQDETIEDDHSTEMGNDDNGESGSAVVDDDEYEIQTVEVEVDSGPVRLESEEVTLEPEKGTPIAATVEAPVEVEGSEVRTGGDDNLQTVEAVPPVTASEPESSEAQEAAPTLEDGSATISKSEDAPAADPSATRDSTDFARAAEASDVVSGGEVEVSTKEDSNTGSADNGETVEGYEEPEVLNTQQDRVDETASTSIEPIRLTFNGSSFSQSFALFSVSSEEPSYRIYSGDDDSIVTEAAPRLNLPDEVFWQPLDKLFSSLRVDEALGEFVEDIESGHELILHLPELELTVREDSTYLQDFTLADIIRLHHGLGREDSLHLALSEEQSFAGKVGLLSAEVDRLAQEETYDEAANGDEGEGNDQEREEQEDADRTAEVENTEAEGHANADADAEAEAEAEAEQTFVTVGDGSDDEEDDEHVEEGEVESTDDAAPPEAQESAGQNEEPEGLQAAADAGETKSSLSASEARSAIEESGQPAVKADGDDPDNGFTAEADAEETEPKDEKGYNEEHGAPDVEEAALQGEGDQIVEYEEEVEEEGFDPQSAAVEVTDALGVEDGVYDVEEGEVDGVSANVAPAATEDASNDLPKNEGSTEQESGEDYAATTGAAESATSPTPSLQQKRPHEEDEADAYEEVSSEAKKARPS